MEPFDFVNRANADYIDRLYEKYQKDPVPFASSGRRSLPGLNSGVSKSEKPRPAPAVLDGGAAGRIAAEARAPSR